LACEEATPESVSGPYLLVHFRIFWNARGPEIRPVLADVFRASRAGRARVSIQVNYGALKQGELHRRCRNKSFENPRPTTMRVQDLRQ
jgi:hypothetical protein